MLKEKLKEQILSQFKKLPRDVTCDKSLFKQGLDSLDYLTLLKIVERVAKDEGKKFAPEDFLYSDSQSIEEIIQYITQQ